MSYRVALASISLLLGCVSVYSAEVGEDVMLRSEEQWETMESIHRHAVDVRLREVVDRGTFDTTPTLGYKGEFNWVDVWGPTYICPTMEHFGTVGDGGKWVCGVETMLQRYDTSCGTVVDSTARLDTGHSSQGRMYHLLVWVAGRLFFRAGSTD